MAVGLQFLSKFSTGLVMMLAIALVGCGGAEPEPSGTTDSASIPTVQGEPLESTPPTVDDKALDTQDTGDKASLEAGAYCYRADEPEFQAIAELLVEPDSSVTGTLEATVNDAANGVYDVAYDQTFAGELAGDQLTASITTNLEADVQTATETWTLNDQQLSSDSATFLKRVNCEEIIALKISQTSDDQPVAIAPATVPAPAPASAPTSTATSAPVPVETLPPTDLNSQPTPAPSTPLTVAFNTGSTETVVNGNLAAGQSQTYLIGAEEGQSMYLEIANSSGKAVFDVEVDNGEYIEGDLPEFIDFILPFSGTYIVTVKAREDNTNFALTVQIQ